LDQWTPLHAAVIKGAIGIVEVLLEFGASPNGRDSQGRTPLYLAVTAPTDRSNLSLYPLIVKALIDHGADPSICHRDGSSPILQASVIALRFIDYYYFIIIRSCFFFFNY
jgi:ankyrin repeat protein